jgi:putative DNA primase/helicase
MTDTFREACRAADAKRAAEAKKANPEQPPELTSEIIMGLAGMTPLQYAQELGRAAKKHKISIRLLEKAVDAVRTEKETETLLEPHWEIRPAAEPVNAAKLIADIKARILHHVAMPQHIALVVALWIAQDWIHEHGTYSPILLITSAEKDSGKTTLMGVISFLVRRAILSVSISPGALYRSIEKWNPSFVIDEADEAFENNPELRSVVNSGWTRGQGVMRCDPDTNEPRRFPTFCPKAIALKGKRIPDTTLSRAIIVQMKRRLRSERIAHFTHLDDDGFTDIRNRLARWAADNGAALGLVHPAMPDGFMNRAANNWQLIFAIADSLGPEIAKQAREAAEQIAGIVDVSSAGVEALAGIRAIFEETGEDEVPSATIVAKLTADPESRWCEWGKARKPISQWQLGRLLSEYGISSETVHPRGVPHAKGYKRAHFEDLWKRYLPPQNAEDPPVSRFSNRATVQTPIKRAQLDDFQTVQKTSSHGLKNANLSYSHGHLHGCTFQKAGSGPTPAFGASNSGGNGRATDDFPDIPESLRRRSSPPEVCAYCHQPADYQPLQTVADDWRQARLHRRCEIAWVNGIGSKANG